MGARIRCSGYCRGRPFRRSREKGGTDEFPFVGLQAEIARLRALVGKGADLPRQLGGGDGRVSDANSGRHRRASFVGPAALRIDRTHDASSEGRHPCEGFNRQSPGRFAKS